MPGIADWLAFGLPTEGKETGKPRAGDVACREVPTCALTDLIGDARAEMSAARWGTCLVTDGQGIVLGRVRAEHLEGGEQTVDTVMEPGPTTVRQSEYLDALVKRMKKKDVSEIIVTNSTGELVGVLRRDEAEQRLAEQDAST